MGKKRWIPAMIAFILFLGACSTGCVLGTTAEQGQTETKQELGIPENETQTEWRLSQIEMPDADAAIKDRIPENGKSYGGIWGMAEENIYRILHISSSSDELIYAGSCVQILKPPYIAWESYMITPEEWVEGKSCRPWMFTWSEYVSGDGILHILLQEQEGASYLGRWSVEEGCSAVELYGERMQEEYFYERLPEVWVDGEDFGTYFLYRQWVPKMEYQTLWLDKDDQEKGGMLPLSEGYVWDIAYNPFDGEAYLCGMSAKDVKIEENSLFYSEGGFTIWQEGKNRPVFTTQDTNMTPNSEIAFFSETQGYLWNASGIWKFSMEEQSLKKMYSMDKIGEDTYNKMAGAWRGASVRADGSLLMLSEGQFGEYEAGTCFLWELSEQTVQEREEKEKKELVLAVTFASSDYERMVREFNLQSDEYRLVLHTAEDGESYDDYRTRIQAEMASGGGPDLLVADEVISLEVGARKGYLLELTELFAGYEELLLPSAWKTGQVDGKLYALPYACSVNTLVVSRDVVGDRKSWSLQEAMECMEGSNAVFFAGREDEAGLFYYLGLSTESNSGLVDWENGVSFLNGGEAEGLLQFAVKYADHNSTPDDVAQRVSDGEGLVWLQRLYDVSAVRLAMAVFQNEEAYIGFPVQDGGSGHLMHGRRIAVNQACRNQDGARAFLEFLVSEEYQMQFAEKAASKTMLSRPNGFPVRKEALEQFFIYLGEDDELPEGLSAYGSFTYQEAPLSDEQIERLREVFFTARPASPRAESVMPIIVEEMGSFISGDKSAGQVLDTIQSRVQLYLYEVN